MRADTEVGRALADRRALRTLLFRGPAPGQQVRDHVEGRELYLIRGIIPTLAMARVSSIHSADDRGPGASGMVNRDSIPLRFDVLVPLLRNLPSTAQPARPLTRAPDHLLVTRTGSLQILLHVPRAYVPNSQFSRIIGMGHMVDVPNRLRLAHSADAGRLSSIFDPITRPARMRYVRSRPLAAFESDGILLGAGAHKSRVVGALFLSRLCSSHDKASIAREQESGVPAQSQGKRRKLSIGERLKTSSLR